MPLFVTDKEQAMSKFILTILLAGMSSVAMANSGFYVQGNTGLSQLKANHEGEVIKGNNVGVRVAVGKSVGNFRYAVDLGTYGKADGHFKEMDGDALLEDINKAKAHTLGASVVYDFKNMGAFTPYAGLRLSVNHISHRHNHIETDIATGDIVSTAHDHRSKTNIGYGALAGVQYKINSQLSADAHVEYNDLGKLTMYPGIAENSAKYKQLGINVGVRYNF